MANFFRWFWDYLLWLFWYAGATKCRIRSHPGHQSMEKLLAYFVSRATEMEVTIVGLQNAGKTSLLRVLAVSHTVLHLSHLVKERFDC